MHINAKLLYFDSEQIMGKSFIISLAPFQYSVVQTSYLKDFHQFENT